ncbi:hypothetical protein KUH03_13265 [Sphingobacterium sp. E70]|uniref:hypothetical protein n=1 Tax=Sphingobacterium sp. E70 TaxID=2853439 RepID=UPI00211CC72D|nr:hypothetical protein [Sphingobacterium sp. E70]ULT27584.1 hypothetical protein KUH03_13265 [Sphingobacterium sp. E70]
MAHNIIAQQKDVPINLKEQNAGEIILQKLEDIVKESKIEEKKIIGVGISMPGFVNPEEKNQRLLSKFLPSPPLQTN